MTSTDPRPGTGTPDRTAESTGTPRLVLADRGDALVPHLTQALTERYEVVGQVDAELTGTERLLVAASTYRPARRAWVERFFKSNLAVELRSRRADRRLAEIDSPFDVVFQTHALFAVDDPRAVLYVDCTHRQSAEQWPDWNPLSGRALRRWYARERRQYRRAAHVFSFSQETRDSLVEDYDVPEERVSVVGAGVNFDRLPQLSSPRPSGPPTVLFVGNDFERKGGPRLLEAFRVVRERIPDARLRLAGVPHGIPEQPGVEVLGRVGSREAMSQLYAEASVFCLPTAFDPFPLVLLEAMGHGLPCVVTPSCGIVEMVSDRDNGRILSSVHPSVEELATVLVELLSDPQACARLGERGRRRVDERFRWSHVVDSMAPVFARLADRGESAEPGSSPVCTRNARPHPSVSTAQGA